jgi:Zn-dependent M28 family amino/carboxypeptidase
VLVGIGYVTTAGLAILSALGAPQHPFFWACAALVTLVGAVPVVLSVVGQRSAGALDNASGVTTVISAARALGEISTGILITDAEELGLAGARAWALQHRGTTVLNCDGVDDEGRVVVMFTGTMPKELFGAVERGSETTGVQCRPMRMVPGLLTDSVAFANAGLSSVTFSRGSLRSLARVHSRRDDLTNLRGTGIAETARLMAATARELGEMR